LPRCKSIRTSRPPFMRRAFFHSRLCRFSFLFVVAPAM
jgi:hypothetical protein